MPERPNILLLFTDQQRHDTIAAAGAPQMITPSLDRLVREGCWYAHAHTPNPVCMAARHYLLTGLPARWHGYSANNHRPLRDYNLPTIPRLLSEHGYVTAGIGKMHHLPARMHHGYDELHLMEELPAYREEDAYLLWLEEQGYGQVRHPHGCRHFLYHTPQRAVVPERLHGSAFVAERTMAFIDRNRDRPWYAMASWVKPHPPWDAPAGWERLYDGRDLPEPSPRRRTPPFDDTPSAWYGDFDSPARRRAVRAAYYTQISLIDKQIGRILDHLESLGQLDSTLILFASDHGEMLYDRGMFQKQVPYEPSVRIPLLARWPAAFAPGSIVEEFADLYDLMPTIYEAAGVAMPAGPYLGESLLTATPTRDRSRVWVDHAEGANRWTMLRDRRYKLIHWFAGGLEELYDTVADPGEQHELIAAGEAPPEVLADLRARLLAIEATHGQPGTVVEGAFVDQPARTFGIPHAVKYPLWAHHQFPTWGPLARELEAELMAREIRAATGGVYDDRLDDERWRAEFRQQWLALGGSEAAAREFLGD